MKGRMFVLLVLAMAYLGVPRATYAAGPTDKGLLVDHMLNIKDPRFYENGTYNELKDVQRWERHLAAQYRKAASDAATIEDLKLFLAAGWSAKLNNAAMTAEYMSSTIHPVFGKHPAKIAQILAELPFLVPATCEYLAAYFHFEKEVPELAEKKRFRSVVIRELSSTLNSQQLSLCVQAFGSTEER